jgi:hypothetical protein
VVLNLVSGDSYHCISQNAVASGVDVIYNVRFAAARRKESKMKAESLGRLLGILPGRGLSWMVKKWKYLW